MEAVDGRRYAAWKRSPEGAALREKWIGGEPDDDDVEAECQEDDAADFRAIAALLRQPGAPRTEPSEDQLWLWQLLASREAAIGAHPDRRDEINANVVAKLVERFGGGSASEGGTRP